MWPAFGFGLAMQEGVPQLLGCALRQTEEGTDAHTGTTGLQPASQHAADAVRRPGGRACCTASALVSRRDGDHRPTGAGCCSSALEALLQRCRAVLFQCQHSGNLQANSPKVCGVCVGVRMVRSTQVPGARAVGKAWPGRQGRMRQKGNATGT